MNTHLATALGIHECPKLSERGRDAARAVAVGRRDTKTASTRRTYASAWKQFETWAQAGGHQALPARPQAVAFYLGPLVYNGHAIVSIEKARAADRPPPRLGRHTEGRQPGLQARDSPLVLESDEGRLLVPPQAAG